VLLSSDDVTVDSVAGTVQFMWVQRSDEGTYMCSALNDAGNVSHTAQMFVRGMPVVYVFVMIE